MAEASSIKCPQCNAPLNFDAETGMMRCEFCGHMQAVDAGEHGASTDAGIGAEEGAQVGAQAVAQGEDQSAQPRQWVGPAYEDADGVHAYVCRNCGAEVVATALTATTTCPYCNNNVVLDERLSGGLKPNGVIPFKITKDQLPSLLQEFYKDKPLLPKGFFAENKVEKAQGMYVPFWLFSAEAAGTVVLKGEQTHAYSTRKEDIVETSHYRLHRTGHAAFKFVPVDASKRLDDDVMDSIEPFDYNALTEFDVHYLAGYVAERFDDTPKEVLDRATVRIVNTAAELAYDTCDGYAVTGVESNSIELHNTTVAYVMLPVYLFNGEYDGKKYRYAINGQTGKVVGEVPIGKAEARRAFLVPAGIVAGILAVAGIVMMLL